MIAHDAQPSLEVVVMCGGACDGMLFTLFKTTKALHFPTPHGLLEYHRCDFEHEGMVVFQQDESKDTYAG